MDDQAARAWLASTFDVPRETLGRLEEFVNLLSRENERQNLVSRGSLQHVWPRHIVDSAQLLLHARAPAGSWLDLGTGAGFPGLIVALLHPGPVTMVESRPLRVDFLRRAVSLLGLTERAVVIGARAERLETPPFDMISARAFAPLGRVFDIGERFATPETRWVLPKGRNAKSELEAVESLWQGVFHLEPSVTDPEAGIVVAEGVRRRAKGKRGR
jgi:16S rRNA (guanine527-N7)-methyltransferase